MNCKNDSQFKDDICILFLHQCKELNIENNTKFVKLMIVIN